MITKSEDKSLFDQKVKFRHIDDINRELSD